jgi:hypothetical protein
MRDDSELRDFEKTMKQAYDFFDVTKQIPVVGVTTKGEYVLY